MRVEHHPESARHMAGLPDGPEAQLVKSETVMRLAKMARVVMGYAIS